MGLPGLDEWHIQQTGCRGCAGGAKCGDAGEPCLPLTLKRRKTRLPIFISRRVSLFIIRVIKQPEHRGFFKIRNSIFPESAAQANLAGILQLGGRMGAGRLSAAIAATGS